jgi:hypothetical protein
MKTRLSLVLTLALFLTMAFILVLPGLAQRGAPPAHAPAHSASTPRANGGRIPPAPTARPNAGGTRETEKLPSGHTNDTPHVNGDKFYGHDAPNDPRFHLDHPFPHGHFAHFGPSYRYNIVRFDAGAHRFWLPGGFYFDVAAWDWSLCADWCWNCGSDFVVYEDPDHPGWYLLYNVHTGVYVHCQYMGT